MPKSHEGDVEGLGLHHLRALDAVLTAGSVTAAARRLGLSQSALSHQLARMREVLGDPLVVRGSGGVVPTPRATQLAQPLREALQQLERALAPAVPWDPATARRRFRMALPDHYTPPVLARLLPRLADQAPGIDVDVHPLRRDHVAGALEDAQVELATGDMESAPEHLHSRPFVTTQFACAVRRDHPDVGDTLDLETYLRLGHVLISPAGDAVGLVDTRLTKLGRARRIHVTTSHFLAAPFVVSTSDLALTAPAALLHFMAEREPLRVLPPPPELELPSFSLGLLWHARLDADPGHRWFRAQVAASLK